jgi:peptide/nickel transport system substrate-binding protein
MCEEQSVEGWILPACPPWFRTRLLAIITFAAFLTAVGCDSRPTQADDDAQLTVAMSTFSESTFLPWNGSTGRKLYLDTIYDYLLYVDPDTHELKPGLAEDWEVSADGRTHTFSIRRGVQFQEGWGELSAEDVEYTIERITDPEAIAGPSSPMRSLIRSAEAVEPFKLVINLNSPNVDFPNAYLSNGLVVPIVCKEYLLRVGDDVANRHPIGTGAYTLVSVKKGISATMRIRPDTDNLWRVQPQFSQIRFISVPEEFTRVAMLITGEVDLAPINFDSIDVILDKGLQVIYVDKNWAPVIRLGGLVPLFPNPDVPWQDIRVRQALNYAVDKQTIVKAIFHDRATAAGADFPSRDFEAIPPYPYDPDKARQLLDEAGYPNGFDIRLKTYTTNPGAELPIIAEVVALYWDAIGVRTTIEPTNWIALRGLWSTGKATDIVWTHRGFAFTNTLTGLQSGIMSTSVFAGYSDANTDNYINRIGNSLDRDERARIANEMGQYLRDQAAYVYIAFVDEPFGASRKIGHWPTLSEQGTNIDLITRRVVTKTSN